MEIVLTAVKILYVGTTHCHNNTFSQSKTENIMLIALFYGVHVMNFFFKSDANPTFNFQYTRDIVGN